MKNLHQYLHLSNSNLTSHSIVSDSNYNQSTINSVLKGIPLPFHKPIRSSLILNSHATQYILKDNVIPKVWDQVNINPLVSMVTYFVIFNTHFNESNLFIQNINNVNIVRNPLSKRNITQPQDTSLHIFQRSTIIFSFLVSLIIPLH